VSVTKCGRVYYCHYSRIVIKQCYFLTYISSEISQSNQKTRRHAQERKPGHATGGTLHGLSEEAFLILFTVLADFMPHHHSPPAIIPWQEHEEELNMLLLTKVSETKMSKVVLDVISSYKILVLFSACGGCT